MTPVSATLRQAVRTDVPQIQRVRHSVKENRLTSAVITDEDVVVAIERLFVEPEHERKGHGRRMHDEMVSWLWSRGLTRLWLSTDPPRHFYETAGWQHGGALRAPSCVDRGYSTSGRGYQQ